MFAIKTKGGYTKDGNGDILTFYYEANATAELRNIDIRLKPKVVIYNESKDNVLSLSDNIFDDITFDDIVTQISSNEKDVDEDIVYKTFNTIFHQRLTDAKVILKDNIANIISEVKEGK